MACAVFPRSHVKSHWSSQMYCPKVYTYKEVGCHLYKALFIFFACCFAHSHIIPLQTPMLILTLLDITLPYYLYLLINLFIITLFVSFMFTLVTPFSISSNLKYSTSTCSLAMGSSLSYSSISTS